MKIFVYLSVILLLENFCIKSSSRLRIFPDCNVRGKDSMAESLFTDFIFRFQTGTYDLVLLDPEHNNTY